jgi:hypothetical protein
VIPEGTGINATIKAEAATISQRHHVFVSLVFVIKEEEKRRRGEKETNQTPLLLFSFSPLLGYSPK